MDDLTLFDDTLKKLLELHLQERTLMHELRHAEHEICVEKKLVAALAAEAIGARLPASGPSEQGRALLFLIRNAAQANASIANLMLGQSKDKMDFIRKMSSTSYEKTGQMAAPSLKGGLFSGKT